MSRLPAHALLFRAIQSVFGAQLLFGHRKVNEGGFWTVGCFRA